MGKTYVSQSLVNEGRFPLRTEKASPEERLTKIAIPR